jgi:hypothetical protein
MGYFRMDFWELLLHLLGIVLWCMTIIYLIKDRLDRSRSSLRHLPQCDSKGFNEEMDFQLIRQQVEKTLETLSNAINRERLVLQRLIEKRRMEEKNDFFPGKKPNLPPKRIFEQKEKNPHAPGSIIEKDPYDEVVRLSGLGVSEQEISERVRIPKSEIALIRKLNGCGEKSHAERAPGTGAVS